MLQIVIFMWTLILNRVIIFVRAVYLTMKVIKLKNCSLLMKANNCRLNMVTNAGSVVTSAKVVSTAVNPHKQFAGFFFVLHPLWSQNVSGVTAASCHFVRAMERNLIMRGCLSPWRCRVWVTVKVLYSHKSLVVEFMIKAAGVSLHSSTHALTKTARI